MASELKVTLVSICQNKPIAMQYKFDAIGYVFTTSIG
jgi:hypothetical protein